MNDDLRNHSTNAIGKQVEEIRASGVLQTVKEIQDGWWSPRSHASSNRIWAIYVA